MPGNASCPKLSAAVCLPDRRVPPTAVHVRTAAEPLLTVWTARGRGVSCTGGEACLARGAKSLHGGRGVSCTGGGACLARCMGGEALSKPSHPSHRAVSEIGECPSGGYSPRVASARFEPARICAMKSASAALGIRESAHHRAPSLESKGLAASASLRRSTAGSKSRGPCSGAAGPFSGTVAGLPCLPRTGPHLR